MNCSGVLTRVVAGLLAELLLLISAVIAVIEAVTQRVDVQAVGTRHVRVVVGTAIVVVIRTLG